MTYVDGFVLAIPKKHEKKYTAIAKKAGKVWKKYGALSYLECKGDDLKPAHPVSTFPKLIKLKPTEAVWFSFITYRNKAHRDAVNKKVMKDPLMTDPKMAEIMKWFNPKRMSVGGFKAIVEY